MEESLREEHRVSAKFGKFRRRKLNKYKFLKIGCLNH